MHLEYYLGQRLTLFNGVTLKTIFLFKGVMFRFHVSPGRGRMGTLPPCAPGPIVLRALRQAPMPYSASDYDICEHKWTCAIHVCRVKLSLQPNHGSKIQVCLSFRVSLPPSNSERGFSYFLWGIPRLNYSHSRVANFCKPAVSRFVNMMGLLSCSEIMT